MLMLGIKRGETDRFFVIGQELFLIENTGHGTVKQTEGITHIFFDLLNERVRY